MAWVVLTVGSSWMSWEIYYVPLDDENSLAYSHRSTLGQDVLI